MKTFYRALGWRDEQRPDGTIVLMAPTGHTYITEPFGAELFPALGSRPASYRCRRSSTCPIPTEPQ
jgi:hypothetical protein